MSARMKVICFALLIAVTISGCYIITDSGEINIDVTESTVPVFSDQDTIEANTDSEITEVISNALDEEEYWELVQDDIRNLFRDHNLFVFRTGTEMPYINYYVEFGKPTNDGRYTPVGLTNEECAILKECIQKELVAIISKYQLDEGDSIWNKPSHTILGLFIHNRFINKTYTPAEIEQYCVSGYQVDLLDFYNKHDENSFVKMDYFDSSPWDKFEIYTP